MVINAPAGELLQNTPHVSSQRVSYGNFPCRVKETALVCIGVKTSLDCGPAEAPGT